MMSLKLIAFDLDSTLLDSEGIDELAKARGVSDAVRSITAAAMRGELSFEESLSRRVSMLRGLSFSDYQQIAESQPLMTGARKLFSYLKSKNIQSIIITGGFDGFAKWTQSQLGADQFFSNRLEFDAQRICLGTVKPPILGAQKKAEYLKIFADSQKIPLAQTVAVGDGANDIPMLATAGFGIAFHPKPKLAQSSKFTVFEKNLESLIPLLRDIESLC